MIAGNIFSLARANLREHRAFTKNDWFEFYCDLVWVQERGLPCSPGAGYSGQWFKEALFEILAAEQITQAVVAGAADFLAARMHLLDQDELIQFVQFTDNFCFRGIRYSEFSNTLIRNGLCSAMKILKIEKNLESKLLAILKDVKGEKSTPSAIKNLLNTKEILQQFPSIGGRLEFIIRQRRSARYFRAVFLQQSRKYSAEDVKALYHSLCDSLDPQQREPHLQQLLKGAKGAQRWLLKQCLQQEA